MWHLDFALMRDHWYTVLGRKSDFPDAKIIHLHGMGLPVPVVCESSSIVVMLANDRYLTAELLTEISNEMGLECTGRPLPIRDIAVFVDIEAEFFIALCKRETIVSQCLGRYIQVA